MEPLYNYVKKFAMLAHPGQSQYITSERLLTELLQLADSAYDRFSDKMGHSRKLIDARNYLKNHKVELTAYKKAIESEIIKSKAYALAVVLEDRFNAMLNQTTAIVKKYARSNSLVENINNQIRRYMDTYRCVPNWFCDLFSFNWNFRRFKRGKRASFAPSELLLGTRLTKTWIDILLDHFPYDKLRLAN